MMKELFKKNWLIILGIALGAIGGYLYWSYVGCASGSCPITSSPIISSLWGAMMGGLLLSMFKTDNKSNE